jgi:hypothetical protein
MSEEAMTQAEIEEENERIKQGVLDAMRRRYTPPSQRGQEAAQSGPATKPAMGRFTPPSQRKPPGAK